MCDISTKAQTLHTVPHSNRGAIHPGTGAERGKLARDHLQSDISRMQEGVRQSYVDCVNDRPDRASFGHIQVRTAQILH